MAEDWEDWYAILGFAEPTSDKDKISKAYRQLALRYHPDRRQNKSDPQATERFLKISKAHEILIDDQARKAFDSTLAARLQRKKRQDSMDSKRRKMKERLEEKERAHKRKKTEDQEAKYRAELHVQSLRKESQRKLQEERERWHEKTRIDEGNNGTELNVQWKRVKIDSGGRRGHDQASLEALFRPFGPLRCILLGKSGRRAVISFVREEDALHALEAHRRVPLGAPECPLTNVSWKNGSSAGSEHPAPQLSPVQTNSIPPAQDLGRAKPTSPFEDGNTLDELERQTLSLMNKAHTLLNQSQHS